MSTTQAIKALMKIHDITHVQLADRLGITPPTLRARFKDNNWKIEELFILINHFGIEKPEDVFFSHPNVPCDELVFA